MRFRYAWLSVVAASFVTATCAQSHTGVSTSASSGVLGQQSHVSDAACAQCHASIYKSYEQTPMAHASGPATENLRPADFVHRESNVHFRVYADNGHAWLSFDREGEPSIHGKRELLYYIGSGRRGLTYLFAEEGFVFESPINWYADKHVWDMAPAYQSASEIPLNLSAVTSCLHCHVSGMRPPVGGTENRYEMPLLSHSGVSCERCHGTGTAHLKGGPIVNPAKLSPERRDAICMQCHLEGRVSVERPGRHIYEFKPGDSLADYIRYYVLADSSSPALGAVSQVEALAQSTCKRKSGDSMSCTSCHDPHYSPSAQERGSYFRGKCLACHGPELGTKHHPDEKDCTVCHMPASLSTDVVHTEVTDHRIPRRPVGSPPRSATGSNLRLVPFPDSREAEDDIRDTALAWESLADRGMEEARPHAEDMLRRSAARFPDDAETLTALGYIEQRQGGKVAARDLYRRALALDPNLIEAGTNIGVLEAQSGELTNAISLLQGPFERAPGRSNIGMNLARVFCQAGKFDDSRAAVHRVLEFNPDLSEAKQALQYLKPTNPSCDF